MRLLREEKVCGGELGGASDGEGGIRANDARSPLQKEKADGRGLEASATAGSELEAAEKEKRVAEKRP